jgi:hypothetical protein
LAPLLLLLFLHLPFPTSLLPSKHHTILLKPL